jgi:cation transport ATPase
VVRVAAGGVFPADGVVAWGSSSASEALVTGEPLPVAKGPGARVIGGSVNGEGELGVKVALLPTSGTIARILALIEDAQTRRPRLQGTANAIAAVFTPAVLVASVVVLGAWWGAAAAGAVDTRGLSPPAFALQFALLLLVVSCPCVVVLVVVHVSHAATTLGARLGLLIKGGAALEAVAGVTHVVFDKTGCMSTGRAGLAAARVLHARALLEVALSLGMLELTRLARSGSSSSSGIGAAMVPPSPQCPAAPKAASPPSPLRPPAAPVPAPAPLPLPQPRPPPPPLPEARVSVGARWSRGACGSVAER